MDVIPVARDTDVEDVAWALQTAEALWRRDERIDAIVWLRRAAQAAGEANDDDRALMLARHAAELSEWLANNQGEEPPRPSDAPSAVVEASKSSLGPLDELMAQPQSIPADGALPSFAIESEHPPPVVSDPPSAEQVHAGMLDPWSEPPAAIGRRQARDPHPPPLPQINVPLVPESQQQFEDEEVVTSANFVAASTQEPDHLPPPLPKKAASPRASGNQPIPDESDSDVALEGMGMAAALKEVRDSQRAPLLPQPEPPSPPALPPTRPKPPIPKPAPPKPPLPRPQISKAPAIQTPEAPTKPKHETPAPVAVAVEEETPTPNLDGPLNLDDIEAFSDLPDDARAEFAAAATLHSLGPDEEVSGFALAYVIVGEVDVAATIVDAPAERLKQGAVLRTRGTIGDGMALRLIGVENVARVAAWAPESVEAAFKTCPWVEDDLRVAADRMQALVGITMGTIAERLDPSLRQGFTARLEARTLPPGGILVEKGAKVPGIMLVGVGSIEIVEDGVVQSEITPGDFVFATEILGGGKAHATARAGSEGVVYLFADRAVAQELLVTCPPLLEIFAGM
ncbi:MAG: cyclic nucleotide-binding domain-containing protein [Polyangiaceae bacterium]